jgi:hypothetical protein
MSYRREVEAVGRDVRLFQGDQVFETITGIGPGLVASIYVCPKEGNDEQKDFKKEFL